MRDVPVSLRQHATLRRLSFAMEEHLNKTGLTSLQRYFGTLLTAFVASVITGLWINVNKETGSNYQITQDQHKSFQVVRSAIL